MNDSRPRPPATPGVVRHSRSTATAKTAERKPEHARRPSAGRRGRRPRRNRRRGAPRSLLVRRVLAALLAATAALLALRPQAPTPPSAEAAEEQPPTGIPLVLPVRDAATAGVLTPGDWVDLYVAQGDDPPLLSLSGVRLLDVRTAEPGLTGGADATGSGVHIVVQITADLLPAIEDLLAATSIVATVAAVAPD